MWGKRVCYPVECIQDVIQWGLGRILVMGGNNAGDSTSIDGDEVGLRGFRFAPG